MRSWLIRKETGPLAGASNMAVDEHLFRTLPDEPRTVVRFYQWARPTASLGYGQDAVKVIDRDFCRAHGVDVVRRVTGGKVVLHHREVTYSVSSSDVETFGSTVAGSYKLISLGLMRGLARMGLHPLLAGAPPASYARGTMPCFSHPARDEVEIDGRKIIGSAQKRVGTKFLQHGSIPLLADEGLLRSVSRGGDIPEKIKMISLSEALGRPVDFVWAAEHLVAGLVEFFGVDFAPLVWTNADGAAVERLSEEKYAAESWTWRGEASA
ncbi:MAG: lipoate--protein ligase family protein [Candidatus Aminicenantes bacterium]|nr:lipoate--protein ligase family protein [Candidatus Aminicenantes bacterium]